MVTGPQIKKWFKEKLGIPVRVNKVQVKRPFFQVWIQSEGNPASMGPIQYNHEFPAELGTLLLKSSYGQDTTITFPAGNIQRHSLSFLPEEFEMIVAHYDGRQNNVEGTTEQKGQDNGERQADES